MSEEGTLGDVNHWAVWRFPNWPDIYLTIEDRHGSDDAGLVTVMLGTWAPDLAPEATKAELQEWFGFEDWQIEALTSEDATQEDYERVADWLVEAERNL